MDHLRLRSMTPTEFADFRAETSREHAAGHVAAGNWNSDEAEKRSAQQVDELLPDGVETRGMLVLVAETTHGDLVGQVWVALEGPATPGSGAWIYDIRVAEHKQGPRLRSAPARRRRTRGEAPRVECRRAARLRVEHGCAPAVRVGRLRGHVDTYAQGTHRVRLIRGHRHRRVAHIPARARFAATRLGG